MPVIGDGGVGTAWDGAIAMELGCEGILMNTAIAGARDPVAMARAMRLAIEAGRPAYKAGRIGKKLYASASSPLEGGPHWTRLGSAPSPTAPRRGGGVSSLSCVTASPPGSPRANCAGR